MVCGCYECGNYNEKYDNNCEAFSELGEKNCSESCEGYMSWQKSDYLDKLALQERLNSDSRYRKKNAYDYFTKIILTRQNPYRPSKETEIADEFGFKKGENVE